MTETRTCRYEPCSKAFTPTHWRQQYCTRQCSNDAHYAAHPEKGRSVPKAALPCVASHPLDEAREAQALKKAKRMWRLAIEVRIGETLLATGQFHADDLDEMEIPREHKQLAGTRTGAVASEGLMEKTGDERTRRNPASNYRKAAIYRITDKGRRELSKWIDSRKGELTQGVDERGDAGPASGGRAPFPHRCDGTNGPSRVHQGTAGDDSTNSEGTAGQAAAHRRPGTLDRPGPQRSSGIPAGAESSSAVVSGGEGSPSSASMAAPSPVDGEPAARLFDDAPPSHYDPYSEAA